VFRTRYVRGLATITGWGSIAASLNVGLLACAYADSVLSLPQAVSASGNAEARAMHTQWAKGQLLFALGSSGRSYVVGLGKHWPKVGQAGLPHSLRLHFPSREITEAQSAAQATLTQCPVIAVCGVSACVVVRFIGSNRNIWLHRVETHLRHAHGGTLTAKHQIHTCCWVRWWEDPTSWACT
jgi:hypothetical protein